jgi:hypothetical protein
MKNYAGAYEVVGSTSGESYASYAIFVVKQGETICEAYNPNNYYGSRPSRSSDFGQMSHEEFRLFMIGLVIEVIRLVSMSSQDNTFWDRLTHLFSPNTPQPI